LLIPNLCLNCLKSHCSFKKSVSCTVLITTFQFHVCFISMSVLYYVVRQLFCSSFNIVYWSHCLWLHVTALNDITVSHNDIVCDDVYWHHGFLSYESALKMHEPYKIHLSVGLSICSSTHVLRYCKLFSLSYFLNFV
jgi:hypothetical protein